MSPSGLSSLAGRLPWTTLRPRIFLSYRRHGDSAGFAARLADRLEEHFGDEQCFRDIEDIESGADFVRTIEEAVASSRVMIVVIGTDWVSMQDAHGNRRLDNPDDFV
ncbi:MAG TPA: toll/interleukin-1 receptor domain-containing protein, partial [Longimicrobiales bacterium]|nr:toll/interleukin-1 receptor domain-containing protein [Longimicrobiales bacterium]